VAIVFVTRPPFGGGEQPARAPAARLARPFSGREWEDAGLGDMTLNLANMKPEAGGDLVRQTLGLLDPQATGESPQRLSDLSLEYEPRTGLAPDVRLRGGDPVRGVDNKFNGVQSGELQLSLTPDPPLLGPRCWS
jgi:hypothetical protein